MSLISEKKIYYTQLSIGWENLYVARLTNMDQQSMQGPNGATEQDNFNTMLLGYDERLQ